jgi:hypothetical protein
MLWSGNAMDVMIGVVVDTEAGQERLMITLDLIGK